MIVINNSMKQAKIKNSNKKNTLRLDFKDNLLNPCAVAKINTTLINAVADSPKKIKTTDKKQRILNNNCLLWLTRDKK